MRALALAVLMVVAAACKDRPEGDGQSPATQSPLAEPVATQTEAGDGVTVHDRQRAWSGLNVYALAGRGEARLVDMDGEVVHRWQREHPASAAARRYPFLATQFSPGWQSVELAPDGALYAVAPYQPLEKLLPDSSLSWTAKVSAHDDVAPLADGRVWALTSSLRRIEDESELVLIVDDQLTLLSPEGEVTAQHSLYELLADAPSTARVVRAGLEDAREYWSRLAESPRARKGSVESPRGAVDLVVDVFVHKLDDLGVDGSERTRLLAGTPADVFHAETLRALPANAELWPEGALLLSFPGLDLVCVVSPGAGKVHWAFGPGELSSPHEPSLTSRGTVLVFDRGVASKRSRVVEIDPQTSEIVWSYPGAGDPDFFAERGAAAQELPNGNVLITDSRAGRAFEVTREGDIVWEMSEHGDDGVAALQRVERVPSSVLEALAPTKRVAAP